MAENNVTEVKKSEQNGQISFADDVIAIIAGLATIEIEGVVAMSGGVADGIAEMLGRKNLTRGVKVEVGNEEAAIDLAIIGEYGAKLPEVCCKVQENVRKAVETMTGLHVVEVNISVLGVNTEKKPKEPAEAQQNAGRVR
nr:Asp23/Gls24 family envelope stress response protein [Maliibacterium massiliense]